MKSRTSKIIAAAVLTALSAMSVSAADPAAPAGGLGGADPAAAPAAAVNVTPKPGEIASRQVDIDMPRESVNAFNGQLSFIYNNLNSAYASEAETKLMGRPWMVSAVQAVGGGVPQGGPGAFGGAVGGGIVNPFVGITGYNGPHPGLIFTVDFSAAPGDYPLHGKADALADALGDIIKKHLLEQWRGVKQSLQDDADAKERDLRRLDDRRQDYLTQAQTLRDQLRKTTGRTDLSSTAIKSAIEQLEVERQKLELDVAGMTARRDALDKAVAEQSERAMAAADRDPVAIELSRIVDIRQRQLDLTKTAAQQDLASQLEQAKINFDELLKTGGVESSPRYLRLKQRVDELQKQLDAQQAAPKSDSDPAVQTAVLALAEAKARLAERKLAAAGAGDALAAWNRQLLDLTIDLRERDARLTTITAHLDHFSGSVEQAKKLEEIQIRALDAGRKIDVAQETANQARDQLSLFDKEPKITITKPE